MHKFKRAQNGGEMDELEIFINEIIDIQKKERVNVPILFKRGPFENFIIGKIEKKDVLGEGQYGLVFRATLNHECGNLEQTLVALKEINLDKLQESALSLLKNEIKSLSESMNVGCGKWINKFYGVIYDKPNKSIYLIMELIRGLELNKVQQTINENEEDEKFFKLLFIPLMEGLDCLHRNDIAHRDIKPENVMITTETSVPTACWIDLGLSCFKKCENTTKNIGTPGFIAPEILRFKNFPAEDVDFWKQQTFGLLVC